MKNQRKESLFTKPVVFIIAAVICTVLWGSAFPVVKLGYELFEITATGDKILFASLRFMLAGAVLLVAGVFGNKSKEGRRIDSIRLNVSQLKWVILTAFVQITIYYFFYYIGLSNTQGSVASVINSCDTFLSVLLVPLFFREDRLSVPKIIGCAVGLSGIIIVNVGGFSDFSMTGEFFILLASIFSTFGIILNKKVASQIEPTVATGYFLLIGGAVLAVIAFIMQGKINLCNVKADLVLIYLSGVSGVAFMLWSSLLKYNDVSRTGIFKLLIPVFGNILSALILGENILNLSRLISVVLVAVGIWLVNVRKGCLDNKKTL